jgi:hypothetical protein
MGFRTFATTMVAVILAVFTLASAGWAECAWLMWNRANEQTAAEAWTVVTGFANRKACIHELSARAKDWKKTGWDVAFNSDARMSATSKAGIQELLCLPDVADPRGPKGSAR